jgi:hypothetical protein
VTCEESLEMGGALVFLYALMTYIAVAFGQLDFRVALSSEQSFNRRCRHSGGSAPPLPVAPLTRRSDPQRCSSRSLHKLPTGR